MKTGDEALPRVVVLPQAWRTITEAMERAAHEGIARSGAPDEAIFVPLCGIVHRSGRLRAPRIERTVLGDIQALVVAAAAIPPREMVSSTAVRIRFRPGAHGWQEAQTRFDAMVDEALARHGRLDLLARGHSHPFDQGSTQPSGIDRREHLAPCLRYNRNLGIDAGFTLIAVRGAQGEGWALHAFTTSGGEEVIDLGLAEISEHSDRYATLLEPPFYRTEQGRKLEEALRAVLPQDLRVDRLSLGWSRYRFSKSSGVPEILALPPSFPAAIGRRLSKDDNGWFGDEIVDWTAFLPMKEDLCLQKFALESRLKPAAK